MELNLEFFSITKFRIIIRGKMNDLKQKTNLTSGCASSIARINVVPDRGTPPININGICLWYG